MVLTSDRSDIPPVSSWKPPWEARRETRGSLADGGYDPAAMDSYFELRPERALGRVAQILVEVCGVLLALGMDYLVSGNDTDTGIRVPTGEAEAGGNTPTRIRESVTRLGPNFVKIGQALASRPDLVGEAIAGELLLLQDAMPLFSNEVARRFIHEELGGYPEDIFEAMGDTPVAAASLGQVYKAQIDGRPVAVKVQRPDLLEAVGLDFYVARRVAEAITRLSRSSSFFGGRLVVRSDLVAAVDEYGSRLFEELDYRKEAQNMVQFRELYHAMPGILVPKVLLDYSAKRVITSEWIDGEKLVDNQAQVSPADLPILRVGIECTLTQLLDKGFLHAQDLEVKDKERTYGRVSTTSLRGRPPQERELPQE
ncbi:ABC transporter-like [Ectocarpus siliculosus]|uniref:ABC transporter-like n=1 Tax=Ectocarpus siliculosus TaxID=2880 RepID=D7FNM6_ECTSI|nr:ABC transporter-like [Ectocarpus siliculosus]|eukprot:CBJ26037.1 ABC transporter-like [Ectocarpus siliculosus]